MAAGLPSGDSAATWQGQRCAGGQGSARLSSQRRAGDWTTGSSRGRLSRCPARPGRSRGRSSLGFSLRSAGASAVWAGVLSALPGARKSLKNRKNGTVYFHISSGVIIYLLVNMGYAICRIFIEPRDTVSGFLEVPSDSGAKLPERRAALALLTY